jgi:hypothetical protein
MPEDCIQFIDIEMPKFYNFLRVWDECIKHKNSEKLSNTPAGNIDEMCFSALYCNLTVGNNSDKCLNALTPIHDKWYDSSFSNQVIEEVKSDRKKTIVSSIYELNYIEERGTQTYKGVQLLTQTIRNIIFDGYNYVIYTDKKTRKKHNLDNMFNYPNVSIREVELNSEFYLNEINPVRLNIVANGEIWDRIFCVHNYVEVIYNKIEFLIKESLNFDGEVMWIDAGLFGTSCSNAWRDHINQICHSKNFIDKLFEKAYEFGFICLKGNHILINYELKDRIINLFGINPYIVPGALFGGKSTKIIELLSSYKDYIKKFLDTNEYVSEQEILYLILHDKNVKFFEFDDWDDLQKGMLKILDIYDEKTYHKDYIGEDNRSKYLTNSVVENKTKNMGDIDRSNFTEVADFFGIDKGSLHEGHMYTPIYQEYMKDFVDSTPVLVEIGINDSRFPGGCLYFWSTIFEKMEYYGFDITDCSYLPYDKSKIKTFQGDQNNENDLKEFIYKFDLPNRIDFIIDDGSHVSEHIVTSFKTLYPYLKDGGVYFIEDLHAGWAKREETINEINEIISTNNFKVSEKILKNNDKLLIIKK